MKVEVVLDKSKRIENCSSATFVYGSGIPRSIDAQHAIAHNKVRVINGQTVILPHVGMTGLREQGRVGYFY